MNQLNLDGSSIVRPTTQSLSHVLLQQLQPHSQLHNIINHSPSYSHCVVDIAAKNYDILLLHIGLQSVWLSGVMIASQTGQVVHTDVPLFTKQYNLVPVKGRWHSAAGRVTVGLASHWLCVTDSVVYPPTGSTATEREMSSPPTLLVGYNHLYITPSHASLRGSL